MKVTELFEENDQPQSETINEAPMADLPPEHATSIRYGSEGSHIRGGRKSRVVTPAKYVIEDLLKLVDKLEKIERISSSEAKRLLSAARTIHSKAKQYVKRDRKATKK